MKPKRSNCVVHGVDCKRLGGRYASVLLYNAKARLSDLPELKAHRVYKTLKPELQEAVCNNIRFVARDLLLMAGFAPETVARALDVK